MDIQFQIVIGIIFFMILVSLQYTLNRILVELKKLNQKMSRLTGRRNDQDRFSN